jgi:hypothetical protein
MDRHGHTCMKHICGYEMHLLQLVIVGGDRAGGRIFPFLAVVPLGALHWHSLPRQTDKVGRAGPTVSRLCAQQLYTHLFRHMCTCVTMDARVGDQVQVRAKQREQLAQHEAGRQAHIYRCA